MTMRTHLRGMLLVGCLALAGMGAGMASAQEDCDTGVDYLAEGESLFAEGDYLGAADSFDCLIEAQPDDLAAWQLELEANLYAGAYAAALQTMTDIAIAIVPDNPQAFADLIALYEADLEENGDDDLRLLTGLSFVLWHQYETEAGLNVLDQMLTLDPDNQYARVFRGSSHFFMGDPESGEADFAVALEQQPGNADLYFIIADAWLYGAGDLENALDAALVASEAGLDTPRMNAILGSAYFGLGDEELALDYFGRHIDSATAEIIEADPLAAGDSVAIDILPGETYLFPIDVAAGETLVLTTTSEDGVDSIMVLADADGELVTGNDDSEGFNAGFEWTADEAGSYVLLLSTFEGAGTGEIILTRE